MNIRDVLYMRNTGNLRPRASIQDKFLAQKLSGGGVITTATGNPVSIVTNKAQNAISTILSYSPKQSGSGDPSPTNIRPIEGWTESNVYRADGTAIAYNANTTTAQSGGVAITVLSSTAFEMQSTGVSEQYPASKQLLTSIGLVNGKTYTICAYIDIKTIVTKNVRFGIRAANNSIVPGKYVRVYDVLPVGEDKGLISFRFTYDSSTDNYLSLVQLRSNVNIEPYDFVLSQITIVEDATSDTPEITTISLGGTYYGFSVDVERGVLRADMVTVDLGTLAWETFDAGANIFRANVLINKKLASLNMLCSNYKTGTRTGTTAIQDKTITASGSIQNRVFIKDSDYTDLETFQTAMNGVQLVYELATPLELPLTPQIVALLAGNNTLWTDGDEVSVTYKAKK